MKLRNYPILGLVCVLFFVLSGCGGPQKTPAGQPSTSGQPVTNGQPAAPGQSAVNGAEEGTPTTPASGTPAASTNTPAESGTADGNSAKPAEPASAADSTELPGLPDALPEPSQSAETQAPVPAAVPAPAPAPAATDAAGDSEFSREVLDKVLTEFIASLGELPAEVKSAEEPLKVMYYFVQAMTQDNQKAVLGLMSDKAVSERLTRKTGFGPTASAMKNTDVILGNVQYLKDDQGNPVGAHVGTTWRPKGSQEEGEQIAWVLRQEAGTWRIAGMISLIEPDYPPLVVNFENLDATAKQYAVLECLIRETKAQKAQQQAEGNKTEAKPVDAAPAPAAEAKPAETAPAPAAEAKPTETTPAPAAEAKPAETTPAPAADAKPAETAPAPATDAKPAA